MALAKQNDLTSSPLTTAILKDRVSPEGAGEA